MSSTAAGEAGEASRRAAEAARRSGTARPAPASIGEILMSLLNDLPGLISDRVHLLALELRRARQSFAKMALMVVVAAILAATAWVAFWAFVAVVIVAMGVPWYGVFLLIVVLNCIGAWLAIRRAQALVEDLTLPATVRRLTIAPSAKADSDSSIVAHSSRGTLTAEPPGSGQTHFGGSPS